MAFLKYRKAVVEGWPESPRKAVFLNAIEARITNVEKQLRMASSASVNAAPVN